jgi:hypothetical protein
MTVSGRPDGCPHFFGGFLTRSQSVYYQSMEAAMSLTPELKQSVDKAGEWPDGVEDPETHTAYLIVREDDSRRMCGPTAIDYSDRSLFELGELRAFLETDVNDDGKHQSTI